MAIIRFYSILFILLIMIAGLIEYNKSKRTSDFILILLFTPILAYLIMR